MNGEQKFWLLSGVVWLAGASILALAIILPTKGCAENRERKVRIQFMPEDADKVRELIKEQADG